MEQTQCDSPKGNRMFYEQNSLRTPPTHRTPVRQSDRRFLQTAHQTSLGGFSVLPSHITPPSGLTTFIARNPFEADLTSRLHLSIISPTVFSKVSSKTHCDSPGFTWSVDELAHIHPAAIEEFPVQQMHCTDPDVERAAQAAIDKFFTENKIAPSPFGDDRKVPDQKAEMLTPTRPLEELNTTRESHKIKKDCWTQTVLTLPPQLPKEVEEALKPYFTFNQDQNVDAEDANSSNSSLRRKLFFDHDNCSDDEDDTSALLSPIKTNGSMMHASSPPQGGMLAHGTPLTRGSFRMERTHGTPYAGNISPPDMSPICENLDIDEMSCQSIKSRYPAAARLDFTTDMSIDGSVREDKDLRPLEDAETETNTPTRQTEGTTDLNEVPQSSNVPRRTEESPDHNETTEMLSEQTTPIRNKERITTEILKGKNHDILDKLRIAADWCKSRSDDSYIPGNNTLLGHSGQQSTYNFTQDTGYQTYSMSNITENTDNCSITSIKQSLQIWNDKIAATGDEVHLSDWKDNMKNMFSSTPSKYSRRRDN